MEIDEKFCAHIAEDGQQCRAHHQRNSVWCYMHNPAKVAEADAARRKGGRHSRGIRLDVEFEIQSPPQTPSDVRQIIGKVIAALLAGKIETKQARCLIALCDSWLAALAVEVGTPAVRSFQQKVQAASPDADKTARILEELSASLEKRAS